MADNSYGVIQPYTYQSLYSTPPVGAQGFTGANLFGGVADLNNTNIMNNAMNNQGLFQIPQFTTPEAALNFNANSNAGFLSRNGSTIMGGLQAAAGLWGAYNGMQQNKLVKQHMKTSIAQWNKNYGNQVASYNTQLEDRQNARAAANPLAESTQSYMQRNRLK